MAGDFSQVHSKARWADHQLAALNDAVTEYVDLKPYVARVEDKPEAEAYRVTAHLRYPPPPEIAHIVGDVLNNLQGTVDYLAAELVLREGEIPDIKTVFPIVKRAKNDGTEPWVNINRTKDTGRGEVSVIKDPDVLSRLRAVQPYHNGQDWRQHPLQVLRTLNGESKHRHPAVVATGVAGAIYTYLSQPEGWGLAPNDYIAMLGGSFSPVHDGDEISWVPYIWAPQGGLPEHTDFATFIEFEDPSLSSKLEAVSALGVLADIAVFIDDWVLRPFAPLFGVTMTPPDP